MTWFLVLALTTNALAVIPQPYSTREACEAAGIDWERSAIRGVARTRFACVPAEWRR